MKYREKKSEWFAKRDLSWHISNVISKDQETQKAKVLSYAHLLDSCCQDWYAVVSILENLFQNIKVNFPNFPNVYVLKRLAATVAINSSQRYWRSSGNYSCTLWFFRSPARKGCLWQGTLSHESSNKKAYCAEGHYIMNVGAMHQCTRRLRNGLSKEQQRLCPFWISHPKFLRFRRENNLVSCSTLHTKRVG